jgi:hypothetical protein
MDPLSLLCRLATSVPPPRLHTIHYAGSSARRVHGARASARSLPLTPPFPPTAKNVEPEKRVRKSGYRPWAELLERAISVDVPVCPSCQGRLRLLAVVKNPMSIARYLAAAGEQTEVPSRAPGHGPPYWKSQVLRRQALGDEGDGGNHGRGERAAWPWATRQRNERQRRGGFDRTRAKPASRDDLAPRTPFGGNARARLQVPEVPPRRATTARGRGN